MDVYLNTAGHVKDIRQHRLDQAATLGYHNYAEMSLASKMAGGIDNVQSLIGGLAGPARAAAAEELAGLQEFAKSRGFDDTIREFDVPFFRRKQVRSVFGVDEEELREFFPLPTVLRGVFALLHLHFGLTFTLLEEQEAEVWSAEVSVYRVEEEGEELGHLYLDPYLREDKAYQGGDRGWYVPMRSASQVGRSSSCSPQGSRKEKIAREQCFPNLNCPMKRVCFDLGKMQQIFMFYVFSQLSFNNLSNS